ncbi:unnamed protein product [Didymodactylos carnosus]|uniref:Uncharacterized protein n=1 Tax=Didymodactylos carnosus TaxID=1234261 RepID=A0A814TEC3_9BILA|nr:unnamed protein product [Didymodactylos carnosus]CAF1160686.1 unnamed protein product [Didymodactylos carnosus]CAF3570106.1 unnamed protein product [Didymodactylos carnosus]CAF3924230.1 unnamed protein product [Didymodactylos carnosus]
MEVTPTRCQVFGCTRAPLAVCLHCNNYLCKPHFNEHETTAIPSTTSSLNTVIELGTLLECVNKLHGKVENNLTCNGLIDEKLDELNQWRTKSNKVFEKFCDEKRHEITSLFQNEFSEGKRKGWIKSIDSLKQQVSELIQNNTTANKEDVERVKMKIEHFIQNEMNFIHIKQKYLDLSDYFTIVTTINIMKLINAFKTATEWNLWTCKLTDDDVKVVAQELKINENCQALHLSHNKISDIGVQYLSEMLKLNKKLIKLWIGTNQVSDQGLTILCDALKYNDKLTTLYVHENKITDDSVSIILDMLQVNHSLNWLDVTDNLISKNGKQRLSDGIAKIRKIHIDV